MTYQVVRSWLLLVYVDVLMHCGGLKPLHKKVQLEPIQRPTANSPATHELCYAIDLACVFYFKKVLCLQRSSATVILLRRSGRKADLVIGTQLMPLKSHAWVESSGEVLNDKPYMREIYQVMELC